MAVSHILGASVPCRHISAHPKIRLTCPYNLTPGVQSFIDEGSCQAYVAVRMRIVFADKRLALIRTDRAHELGLPARVIKGAREKLNFLAEAPDERTIRNWKSLNYKRLEGGDDRRQIRINEQYRIVFTIDTSGEPPVITILAIGDPH